MWSSAIQVLFIYAQDPEHTLANTYTVGGKRKLANHKIMELFPFRSYELSKSCKGKRTEQETNQGQ